LRAILGIHLSLDCGLAPSFFSRSLGAAVFAGVVGDWVCGAALEPEAAGDARRGLRTRLAAVARREESERQCGQHDCRDLHTASMD
jgi:hypothetical protein